MPLSVALGGHREFAAARTCQLKTVAQYPLHSLTAMQRSLNSHFIRCAPFQSAAIIDILAFAVLADDDEVNLCGALPGQDAPHARIKLAGPYAGVLVKRLPDLHQRRKRNMVRHQCRPADRAE